MIDPHEAWSLIRTAAVKARDTNMVWRSLVQEKQYSVQEVLHDRIIIYRVDEDTVQALTKDKIIAAAERLNNNGGTIARRTLISPTVAEETAFVLFHPQLKWSENHKYIVDINPYLDI